LNNPLIEVITKKYAELRYQLLPYTYALAYEARATGMPLMRAMWLHYPRDKKASALGNQFMWGRDLLIAPVFEKGATSRTTYLPEGLWYDWWTGEKLEGGRDVKKKVDLSVMPIYVRAGGIIPIDPVRQYTGEKVTEPTTIRVFTGADGQFMLYEDDGISLEYLKGIGSYTGFKWNDRKKTLTIKPDAPKGSVNKIVKREFVVELYPAGTTQKVIYDGKNLTLVFRVD
jgi:alpha-glucosidase/alpha-D-xyloside xylohydrolase